MKTFRHGETIEELKAQEKDARKIMYLNEITLNYKKWKNENLKIKSNNEVDLKKKIDLYKEYRLFIFSKKFREGNTFLGNRKLFETALSEFMYYIVKDSKIIKEKNVILSRATIPLEIKFEYDEFKNIKSERIMRINSQKMRLVCGRKLFSKYRIDGRKTYLQEDFIFPYFIIETAMVLDNWFVYYFQNNLRRIKKIFPKCYAIIVAEVVSDDFNINIADLALDGIYILQRQTTKMKRNKISFEIVNKILEDIDKFFSLEKKDILLKIKKGVFTK